MKTEGSALADEGEREIRVRNFAAAEKLLSKAAQADPASARVQHLLGVSLHEQGNLDRAIACYRKAIKHGGSLPGIQRDLGLAFLAKRRYGDSLACYQQAMRQDPRDELAWQGAASALREMGDIIAARKHFQHALRLKVRRGLRAPWEALRRLW
ncbi:MAG TPA: tetratricopeptide repeat protein [Burkholderiales bacterium]